MDLRIVWLILVIEQIKVYKRIKRFYDFSNFIVSHDFHMIDCFLSVFSRFSDLYSFNVYRLIVILYKKIKENKNAITWPRPM